MIYILCGQSDTDIEATYDQRLRTNLFNNIAFDRHGGLLQVQTLRLLLEMIIVCRIMRPETPLLLGRLRLGDRWGVKKSDVVNCLETPIRS
jgi:hypothetical protein